MLSHDVTRAGSVVARDVEMTYSSGAERVAALRGVSLAFSPGEVVVLMGPSGSGKTTLLSILGGILTPTAGSVEIFDSEITRLSRAELARLRRERIGFVFQGFNLFAALSARENVEVALRLRGVRGAQLRMRSLESLDRVGLAQKAERRPRDLSGGEKQRVAIARALAGKPGVLMADEPTANLDSKNGHAVAQLLTGLARDDRCAVLLVTHDTRITDIADRIIRMEDGLLLP